MESIKINLKTPVKSEQVVNIKDMIETDKELLIKVSTSDFFNIHVGQKLTFRRHIYENENIFSIISDDVTVLSKDNFIHTTKLSNISTTIDNSENKIKYVINEKENRHAHIIKLNNKHNIFPQDLLAGDGELVIKNSSNTILATFKKNEIFIPYKYGVRESNSGDCITFIENNETCGKRYNNLKLFRYDFASDKISKDCILLYDSVFQMSDVNYIETNFNPFYYRYYYYDENGNFSEFDTLGQPVKHCRLYSDSWWNLFDNENYKNNGIKYVNYGNNDAILTYDTSYWETNINLSSYNEESKLGSEDNFNSSFIKNLEESLIPDIIDMERIKYAPMIYYRDDKRPLTRYYKWCSNNDNFYTEIYTTEWIDKNYIQDGGVVNNVYTLKNGVFTKITEHEFYYDAFSNNGKGALYREEYTGSEIERNRKIVYYTYNLSDEIIDDSFSLATAITINLHFRKRNRVTDETRSYNSPLTSGNVYTDGWFVSEEDNSTTWWNGMDYSGETMEHDKMSEFVESSGLTSDLIGYLNFTDNDIYFRKKKVSQTFLRLSFYNSTDPIEQKLLFYSTVFLDSTSLYGKYIKQMLYMKENNLFENVENENVAVVFCDDENSSTRIDTKFSITNEYDRTKSSEGFNLYLFASDRNISMEKNEKTIYMKVEFNHAGNGKTIPMIMWPKKDDKYVSLTTENFFDSLYIPVKILYLNGKYIYYIPDAFKNENGEISLVLFEPKLDFIDKDSDLKEDN